MSVLAMRLGERHGAGERGSAVRFVSLLCEGQLERAAACLNDQVTWLGEAMSRDEWLERASTRLGASLEARRVADLGGPILAKLSDAFAGETLDGTVGAEHTLTLFDVSGAGEPVSIGVLTRKSQVERIIDMRRFKLGVAQTIVGQDAR